MASLEVSPSIEIKRSPEEVFDAVADYQSWTSWSPWLRIDPDVSVSVEGDGSSVGSIYRWDGEIVGAGEIEHRHLRRPSEI